MAMFTSYMLKSQRVTVEMISWLITFNIMNSDRPTVKIVDICKVATIHICWNDPKASGKKGEVLVAT